MNVLINFIPIKKGGGQQVASNFINQIIKRNDLSITFLATKYTYIEDMLINNSAQFISVRNDLVSRFCFQWLELPRIIRKYNIDVIYTVFGPGLHNSNTLSITGCAYSNLFFPEINFWSPNSFFQKIKFKLIDFYRLKSTLKSDAIVFENEAMQKRASELFNYPLCKTKLILPSVSDYIVNYNETLLNKLKSLNENHFKILLLTGWHKNKNIEILPFVLYELKRINVSDVTFVVSVSKLHPDSIILTQKAIELGVLNNIYFIDTVTPNDIPLLFQYIDGVGLFSLLESFSNNIIEAWYFNKPLFISDKEWSRGICKNAAIYVDRTNAKDIARKIIFYRNNPKIQDTLNSEMNEILKSYPNPAEKVNLQVEFIKKVYRENRN